MVIEYNGEQYYKPIEYFGGENRFFKQQLQDNIKKEWCKNHSVIYKEIPHTDITQLNIEYIKKIIFKEK